MTGHGEKYSNKKDEAIQAMLSHSSIPAAAKAIGVGDKTLWRWTQKEEFQVELKEVRRSLVQHASVRLQTSMVEAVTTLRTVMNDSNSPASVRVSAARAVLDMGYNSIEAEDFEERLSVLERHVKDNTRK
jgi:uncharacterized protein (UPF0147 family)